MLLTIISAALGGLCGWILIRCVSLFVLRDRLKRYLEATLTLHLSNLSDIESWLYQVMQETIRVGSVVKKCALLYSGRARKCHLCARALSRVAYEERNGSIDEMYSHSLGG